MLRRAIAATAATLAIACEWRTPAGDVVGVELYDHEADPGENVNAAVRAESRALIDRLRAELRASGAFRPPKR